MNRLYTICFVFIVGWSSAFAQQDTLLKKSLLISLSPCSLIDINDGPSLRLGAEYKGAGRLAFCIDGKKYFYFSSASGWLVKKEVIGQAVMPCIKVYLGKRQPLRSNSGKYILLRYTYKDQAHTLTDSVSTGSVHVLKPFRMHQYTNSFCLAYGETTMIGKSHFVIDWYAGAGVRFIRSSSDLRIGEHAYDYHDWTGDLTFYPNTATGNLVYPTISLGLMVGYQLLL